MGVSVGHIYCNAWAENSCSRRQTRLAQGNRHKQDEWVTELQSPCSLHTLLSFSKWLGISTKLWIDLASVLLLCWRPWCLNWVQPLRLDHLALTTTDQCTAGTIWAKPWWDFSISKQWRVLLTTPIDTYTPVHPHTWIGFCCKNFHEMPPKREYCNSLPPAKNFCYMVLGQLLLLT